LAVLAPEVFIYLLVIVLPEHSESKLGMARPLGPLLFICGAGGGSYPKRVMGNRRMVVRFHVMARPYEELVSKLFKLLLSMVYYGVSWA
jgi:hypothetical protein